MQRRFTLIEMLVTLIVMVMLATVAVRGTSGFVDQARYERTITTLDAVESALIDSDGFIRDMGRAPTSLDELYDDTLFASFDFDFRAPTDDTDVTLVCGWRGPYLRLPIGANSLVDGWGEAFELSQAGGVLAIKSTGADRVDDGKGYATDIEKEIMSTAEAKVFVQVPTPFTPCAGDEIVVRVYHPDVDNGRVHYQEETIDAQTLTAGDIEQVTVEGIPLGQQVLRVYYPSVPGATLKSAVRQVVIDKTGEQVGSVTDPVEVVP